MHFATTLNSRLLLAPISFAAPFIAMCTERFRFFLFNFFLLESCCRCRVERELAAARQQRIERVSMLRGETTVWMCGRMERRGRMRRGGEWRRKASSCFHPMEANPLRLFTSLHQIKWAGCGSGALCVSFPSTLLLLLLHPSVVMGLSRAGERRQAIDSGNEL